MESMSVRSNPSIKDCCDLTDTTSIKLSTYTYCSVIHVRCMLHDMFQMVSFELYLIKFVKILSKLCFF